LENRTPKRRFEDLQVNEVSLVDSPAIEVEFLVTKNHTEDSMPKDDETTSETETTKTTVPVTQAAEGPAEAVQKALSHVKDIVSDVTKALSGNKEAATPAPAASEKPAEPAAGGAEKTEVAKTEPKTEPKEGEKPATEDKAVVEGLVTKALDSFTATIETLKAARMTAGRMEKIKSAIDALKMVIEGIGEGESPDTKTPTDAKLESGIKPSTPEPVIKAADLAKVVEDVTKAVVDRVTVALKEIDTNVTKAIDGVKGRVEAIEKARPAPTGDGDGDTAKVTKSQGGSFWGGLV